MTDYAVVTGKSKANPDGTHQTPVTLTHADGTVTEDVARYIPDGTTAPLTARLREIIALLDRQKRVRDVAPLPAGVAIDLSEPERDPEPEPVEPPPPTQTEIERDQWFADLAKHRREVALAALPDDLRARYRDEYGGLF